MQWLTLFSLRGIKSCGEWKCSNYVVVKCFLRSQFSNLNVLCVNDHILNSFIFLIYQQGVQLRESHASVKIMASVANVRLQRIWNEDWSKTKKQNNEKLSLRMADKFLSFNHNNIKCKRKTTHQKAVRNGLKCDEWRHRLVSRHAHGGCIYASRLGRLCVAGLKKSPVSQHWKVRRDRLPNLTHKSTTFSLYFR